MDIYTLNVGQGHFSVVVGKNEAFVVDTHVPLSPKFPVVNVKAALDKILDGKKLTGLLITGFDSDHFNEIGLKIVLNKYRPDWVAYPKYFKDTANAKVCFQVIDNFDSQKKIKRMSINLSRDDHRFYDLGEFSLELFSPHSADMISSNNCSLVAKVTEKSTGARYLVTGDTELVRWDTISKIFGSSLKSHVLSAAHHGSNNGCNAVMLGHISPHTVLISCGVENQYGHPGAEALALYRANSKECWTTKDNHPDGQSLRTTIYPDGTVRSFKFTVD